MIEKFEIGKKYKIVLPINYIGSNLEKYIVGLYNTDMKEILDGRLVFCKKTGVSLCGLGAFVDEEGYDFEGYWDWGFETLPYWVEIKENNYIQEEEFDI